MARVHNEHSVIKSMTLVLACNLLRIDVKHSLGVASHYHCGLKPTSQLRLDYDTTTTKN